MTSLSESFRLIKKWGLIQIVLYSACAISLYFYWDPLWLLASLVSYMIIGMFGLEIGHHRYFCHKSFTTNKIVDRLLLICTIFVGAGPTIFWTALHRYHHKYSDTDDDPHRPVDQPILTYFHCCDRFRNTGFDWAMAGDLWNDPIQVWLLSYYNILYFSLLAIIYYFSPHVALYCFIIPAILSLHASGFISTLSHKYGYQNFTDGDSSRNNFWINLFVFGGGLHNNHHANQRSYTTKVLDKEWDLSGWIIKNILATSVKNKGI